MVTYAMFTSHRHKPPMLYLYVDAIDMPVWFNFTFRLHSAIKNFPSIMLHLDNAHHLWCEVLQLMKGCQSHTVHKIEEADCEEKKSQQC